ncbi:MAG: addiction module antidote protein, HigA family [Actinobacteria bacterium]|nr:addiction module antidote protein, HigA family [Actinomycetota bacterium]
MKNPVHPGAILREDVIRELGLSVAETAKRLGVSRVTLSRVVNEHSSISANLALRLEAAGVGTARAWLALQTARDIAAERAGGLPKVTPLDTLAS